MHVTSKEVVASKEDKEKYPGVPEGAHVLTSVVEADGAIELASDKASLSASVLSVSRTASGGVEVKTVFSISEPEPVKVLSVDEQALAYLSSKGITGQEAADDLEKFGASRILAQKSEDEAKAQAALDEQLKEKLA